MKLLILLALLAAPANAQQMREWTSRHRQPVKEEPAPIALALNLTFSTTFWQEVQISTNGAVVDLSRLSRQGFYKLELIQLLLMSHEVRQPLSKTVEKRNKGASLRDIAGEYRVSYDKLYDSSLAVEELVDKKYLPLFPEKRRKRERDEW